MTAQQTRLEINKILMNLPEESLLSVLEYLQSIQKVPAEKIKLAQYFNLILREDKEVLKKLAE